MEAAIAPFGPWLAARLAALQLTQRELGLLVGVSQQAVSCWVRGSSLPGVRVLSGLSTVLGVSLASLMAHAEAGLGS